MSSVKAEQIPFRQIGLVTLKSTYSMAKNHQFLLFTLFHNRNYQHSGISWTNIYESVLFDQQPPPMEPQFYSSRRKTVHFDFASTSEASTGSPRKIDIPYHSSRISLMPLGNPKYSPKSTLGTRFISFESPKVMSGKQRLEPNMVHSSGLSCHLDLLTLLPLFKDI